MGLVNLLSAPRDALWCYGHSDSHLFIQSSTHVLASTMETGLAGSETFRSKHCGMRFAIHFRDTCMFFLFFLFCFVSPLPSRQYLVVSTNQKRAAGFSYFQNSALLVGRREKKNLPSSKCCSCYTSIFVISVAFNRTKLSFSGHFFSSSCLATGALSAVRLLYCPFFKIWHTLLKWRD